MADLITKEVNTSKASDDLTIVTNWQQLLGLIDKVWNAATESEEVPHHEWASRLINDWMPEQPPAHETGELQRALHVIDEAGKLSDWINRARPVVTDLMAAYERRIRTDCTPEQLAKKPWRCMEYIGAENLLRDQPIAVVELTTQKAGEQR